MNTKYKIGPLGHRVEYKTLFHGESDRQIFPALVRTPSRQKAE